MNEILESVAHHCEQSEPNYCLPACACIVLSRLGRQMRQDEVCAMWQGSRRGFALEDAAPLLDGGYLSRNPNLTLTYDRIQSQLQGSHWIVACVFAAKIAQLVQTMGTPPISRFGPIWQGGFGLRHAVVLTGALDKRFYYLDPYYPAPGQPFSISRNDFLEAFQGELIQVPLR